MADQTDHRQDLLRRVNARRAGVGAYLRRRRPRVRRWATVTLVLTSLSAVFTAGPALGGVTFAEAVQNVLGLNSSSTVWKALCFLALLVSVGATVLTNINRSRDPVAELSAVEAADAELEGLATLLEFGTISVEDGAKLYQQYVTKIPFIDDAPVAARPG
jgi:cytochrome bd-type quinol oxidase subunit 2